MQKEFCGLWSNKTFRLIKNLWFKYSFPLFMDKIKRSTSLNNLIRYSRIRLRGDDSGLSELFRMYINGRRPAWTLYTLILCVHRVQDKDTIMQRYRFKHSGSKVVFRHYTIAVFKEKYRPSYTRQKLWQASYLQSANVDAWGEMIGA